MSRSTALKGARIAFALLVAAFLVKVGVDNASQLRHVHLRARPRPLIAGAPLVVLAGLLLPLAWRRLVSAWGTDVPARVALRIWVLSQASRYLLTGVATLASRTALSAKAGVARSLAAASTLVEIGILVVLAAVGAAACLPSRVLAAPVRLAAVIVGLAALAALPVVLRFGGRALPRLHALRPEALRTGRLYETVAIDAASIALRCLAFVLFAIGLLPHVGVGDGFLLAGALQAAALVGLIGFTPAGLGVREGVLAGLLHRGLPQVTLGDAAAVAVAWRAYEFVFEVGWVVTATVMGRKTQVRARAADNDGTTGDDLGGG
ncbi:MAG: hypothetical protein JWO37_3484 [Acidimicrobiales bacterium]|nr:hypothetical protein [Acidimicrobiales bacterium]